MSLHSVFNNYVVRYDVPPTHSGMHSGWGYTGDSVKFRFVELTTKLSNSLKARANSSTMKSANFMCILLTASVAVCGLTLAQLQGIAIRVDISLCYQL